MNLDSELTSKARLSLEHYADMIDALFQIQVFEDNYVLTYLLLLELYHMFMKLEHMFPWQLKLPYLFIYFYH